MRELDHHHENESRYSCSRCEETGIDIESREYCTACELGKRRMNLDRLAEPLRHHPFSNAMWVAHHSAMKTERAIAAAEMALLKHRIAGLERELAEVRKDAWQPIETAPKDGTEVFLWLQAPFNRIEKARWFDLWENWQLGEFPDAMDEYCGIGSKVPTHYMPIPAAPSIAQDGQKSEGA